MKVENFQYNLTRFLIWVFAMIGALVVLNWSIEIFKTAGSFYFSEKAVLIEGVGAMVKTQDLTESLDHPRVEGEIHSLPSAPGIITDVVLDKIYQLESSQGKYDACRTLGLYNGYGYNPGQCFKSENEAREKVKWQLEKYFEWGMNLSTALCYYNTGLIIETCDYLSKFNSIK